MTPELCPVWWTAIWLSRSSTQIWACGRRAISSRATARPTMPPPMTAMSALWGGGWSIGTGSGAAGLHLHCARTACGRGRSRIHKAGAVERFVAPAAQFAGGRLQPGGDLGRRWMMAEDAAGDHQRRRRGDVGRGHRGPFVAVGDPEAFHRAAREGDLEDVPARLFGF